MRRSGAALNLRGSMSQLPPADQSPQTTTPVYESAFETDVHGFWARGTTTISDIRVTNTNARSQCNVDPHRVLLRHKKE